jgi:hypothetical protein
MMIVARFICSLSGLTLSNGIGDAMLAALNFRLTAWAAGGSW